MEFWFLLQKGRLVSLWKIRSNGAAAEWGGIISCKADTDTGWGGGHTLPRTFGTGKDFHLLRWILGRSSAAQCLLWWIIILVKSIIPRNYVVLVRNAREKSQVLQTMHSLSCFRNFSSKLALKKFFFILNTCFWGVD